MHAKRKKRKEKKKGRGGEWIHVYVSCGQEVAPLELVHVFLSEKLVLYFFIFINILTFFSFIKI